MLFNYLFAQLEAERQHKLCRDQWNEKSKTAAFKNAITRKEELEKVVAGIEELYKKSPEVQEAFALLSQRNTLLTMCHSAEDIYENGMFPDHAANTNP
jgi:hypothetical protein